MTDALPPVTRRRAAAAMLKFSWEADHTGAVLGFVLFGLQALAMSLFAYWLKLFIDGLDSADTPQLTAAAAGLTISIVGSSALAYAGNRVRDSLRDRTQRLLGQRMLELMGSTPTLEMHETPEHLKQIDALGRQGHSFGYLIPSLFNFFATSVRIVTTTLLLIAVHPALLALPLFGLPMLLLSGRTSNLFHVAMELTAEPARRAQHLVELTATAGGAKEMRLFRLGPTLLTRFHRCHREIRTTDVRLRVRAAYLGLASQLVFLLGYFGAILFVVNLAITGHATVGDTVLIAVLAGQVLGLVTGSAEILQNTLRGLLAASRWVYLHDVARRARDRIHPTATVPDHLHDGIHLQHLTYHYPLNDTPALTDVTLTLPAGATIAIVGENGAGKSTLVKLLTGMYVPTAGSISLDHTDLTTIDPEQWRQRISASFQDHGRFEFLVRETVGIGDLTTPDEHLDPRVTAALENAAATDITDTLPAGLHTQLGASWPNGTDLSGGQWQKLAIGCAMMRTTPLLLVLDEPTAALDADTEHQLFEQWTATARTMRNRTGAITILVSHRFSTVRMADLIVVLDHGRLIEVGNHEQLITAHGLYAELFNLQAKSYR